LRHSGGLAPVGIEVGAGQIIVAVAEDGEHGVGVCRGLRRTVSVIRNTTYGWLVVSIFFSGPGVEGVCTDRGIKNAARAAYLRPRASNCGAPQQSRDIARVRRTSILLHYG
jgi:hypothetical protein